MIKTCPKCGLPMSQDVFTRVTEPCCWATDSTGCLIRQRSDMGKRLAEVVAVLREASNHLDFCGYGDSYERECARDDKLPQRIKAILEREKAE